MSFWVCLTSLWMPSRLTQLLSTGFRINSLTIPSSCWRHWKGMSPVGLLLNMTWRSFPARRGQQRPWNPPKQKYLSDSNEPLYAVPALDIDPLLLQHAGPSIQNDLELCVKAVQQNRKALEFVSKALKDHPAFRARINDCTPWIATVGPNLVMTQEDLFSFLFSSQAPYFTRNGSELYYMEEAP